MRTPTMYLLAALGAAALGGCATSRGTVVGASGRKCLPTTVDATFEGLGPVYRNCDVDQQAKALYQPYQPDLSDTPQGTCATTTVQFIVGATGVPFTSPIRVVKRTSPRYAQSLVQAIPYWAYKPAMLDGKPVAQVVETRRVAWRPDLSARRPKRQPSDFNSPCASIRNY